MYRKKIFMKNEQLTTEKRRKIAIFWTARKARNKKVLAIAIFLTFQKRGFELLDTQIN